jgi:lipoprotein-anchoring transpeptidase ErfK/SrfK
MKQAFLILYFVSLALCVAAQQQTQPSNKEQTQPIKKSSQLDPIFEAQVWLDRREFSPGEIDGKQGKNTEKAIAAFQEANNLPVTSKADAKTLKALREQGVKPIVEYTITKEDLGGPFADKIPDDFMAMAKLERLAYTSPEEALAEKFHVSQEVLNHLNPQSKFSAGEKIKVPNVFEQKKQDAKKVQQVAGKKSETGAVTVVLSKAKQQLVVKDGDGKTIFFAPITAGSEQYPYPAGTWKVKAVAPNPTFHYNPELFKDSKPGDEKTKVAPGPNSPVGVVWIDLTAEHYGIHGTPSPETIGYAESHGCIRLTNWDVQTVASMVKPGTTVIFE